MGDADAAPIRSRMPRKNNCLVSTTLNCCRCYAAPSRVTEWRIMKSIKCYIDFNRYWYTAGRQAGEHANTSGIHFIWCAWAPADGIQPHPLALAFLSLYLVWIYVPFMRAHFGNTYCKVQTFRGRRRLSIDGFIMLMADDTAIRSM